MSSHDSGELKFAALHADDLLLDALGARRPVGGADGSTDVVANLLQAYALEVDTRTGPLTGLLTADSAYDAADYVPMPQPVAAMVPPPAMPEPVVELPTHRHATRGKFLVAHRAAAVVTVGSLVLGLGGVSAAVSGPGAPLDGIRRVVNSVTEQVTPQQSATERVSRTLADAEKALAASDLRSARELLEKARTAIEGADDPTAYSGLRGNLIELRDRWHRAFDQAEAETPAQQGDGKIDSVRGDGDGVLRPDGKPGLGSDKGQQGDEAGLPVNDEPSDIKQTKDQIADHAEQKLEPLPDLPVGDLREPTWAPIVGDGGTLGGK
ncbi:MAG TPA: anti-sigma-D factor RsdA [Sporichthya sp.]|nr:anti-sigma-D factor RsdA [Sporichthya sp.]